MSMRDALAGMMIAGAGFALGRAVGRKQRQAIPGVSTVPEIMDRAVSFSFGLSPLQLLDAQFDIANQTLIEALSTARQKAIYFPNDRNLDPVPSRISGKQAALAIAVMGKIGQLAEVIGAVAQVTSEVQGLKDEAEKMKTATSFFGFGGALLGAVDGLITLVERPKSKP